MMQSPKRAFPLIAFVLLNLCLAYQVKAGDFSFGGNFTQDDNVQLLEVVVTNASTITIRSKSYAGGVNSAGATITSGGFDPYITVFDAPSRFIIDENDDGGPEGAADPLTGGRYDAFVKIDLAPGSYVVALTQHANFPAGFIFSDGFLRSGQGNFTPALFGPAPCGQFVDNTINCRTGHWALDIMNVQTARLISSISDVTPTPTPTPSPTPTPESRPVPVLVSEADSNRAIALDSVTFTQGPFASESTLNFSPDRHTRVMLLATNLELLPGESFSVVTAQAVDAEKRIYPLVVEYVGRVPNFAWFSSIIIRMPDNPALNGDIVVHINLPGVSSNNVVLHVKASP